MRETAADTLSVDTQTVRDFATIANRPDKTHGGIKNNLTGALAPLKNPLLRYSTEGNTFDLRALRSERMSVYMTVKKPDLTPLRPIVNLFFQQLMDEFAQLGRLDSIFEGVAFFRSFGLRLLAILQSPSQLRTNYSIEGAKTFEQSFDCSVLYTPDPRDIETAELISKLLGNNSVKGRSESKRKGLREQVRLDQYERSEARAEAAAGNHEDAGGEADHRHLRPGADLRQQGAGVGRADASHAHRRSAHPAEQAMGMANDDSPASERETLRAESSWIKACAPLRSGEGIRGLTRAGGSARAAGDVASIVPRRSSAF